MGSRRGECGRARRRWSAAGIAAFALCIGCALSQLSLVEASPWERENGRSLGRLALTSTAPRNTLNARLNRAAKARSQVLSEPLMVLFSSAWKWSRTMQWQAHGRPVALRSPSTGLTAMKRIDAKTTGEAYANSVRPDSLSLGYIAGSSLHLALDSTHVRIGGSFENLRIPAAGGAVPVKSLTPEISIYWKF